MIVNKARIISNKSIFSGFSADTPQVATAESPVVITAQTQLAIETQNALSQEINRREQICLQYIKTLQDLYALKDSTVNYGSASAYPYCNNIEYVFADYDIKKYILAIDYLNTQFETYFDKAVAYYKTYIETMKSNFAIPQEEIAVLNTSEFKTAIEMLNSYKLEIKKTIDTKYYPMGIPPTGVAYNYLLREGFTQAEQPATPVNQGQDSVELPETKKTNPLIWLAGAGIVIKAITLFK